MRTLGFCSVLLAAHAALVLGALGLGGCQTVVNGVTQPINIKTDPAGAVVAIEGVPSAVTPATIRLPRGRDTTVVVTKAGYAPETILFTTQMDGNIIGTLLSGAIVGGVVDLATGAAFKLSPDKLDLTMRRTEQPPAMGLMTSPPAPIPARLAAPTPTRPALPALANVDAVRTAGGEEHSLEGRLRALERLRAERLISEDEYVTVRQQILAALAEAGGR